MTPPLGIAVVGAGAAGLAAALELVRQGASDVVVFEAGSDVGGKVCSKSIAADAHGELGQLAIVAGYERTLALARQCGVEVVPMTGRSFALQHGTIALEDLHTVQAAWVRWRHAVLHATSTDADVDRSVCDVVASLDVDDAFTNPLARVLWTACGYGALTSTSTPAIYLRRYLERVAIDEPVTLRVPGGQQQLWRAIKEALAPRAIVLTGAAVAGIAVANHDSHGLAVRLAGGDVRHFAQVVCAVPPAHAAAIIDDDAVGALLRRYRPMPYRSALVKLPGLNTRLHAQAAMAGAAWSGQRRGGGGRMVRVGTVDERRMQRPQVLWGVPGQEDLFNTYQYGDDAVALDQAIADVAREIDVADPAVVAARQWDYFPHLAKELRRETEDALTKRQGEAGLWLTGAWRTFESVEHAVVDGENVARAVWAQAVAASGRRR